MWPYFRRVKGQHNILFGHPRSDKFMGNVDIRPIILKPDFAIVDAHMNGNRMDPPWSIPSQEMNDVDTKYVQHNMVLLGLLSALLVALITLIGQVSSYIIIVVGAVIFFLALLSYTLHIRELEVIKIIPQSINEIKVRRSIKEKRQRQEVRQYLDNCFLERLLSESL